MQDLCRVRFRMGWWDLRWVQLTLEELVSGSSKALSIYRKSLFEASGFCSSQIKPTSSFLGCFWGCLRLSVLPPLSQQWRQGPLFFPFWQIPCCTLENRFDSTLETLSRDCFCTPGQDAQERVRYATECWFGILDRQHVCSSLREEWEYMLSHVRHQPNCNDTRWFNPSSVALCRRCSEPRWLCVKRDDRRSLDDLPKMVNGAGVPMEVRRRLAWGPFVTLTISEGDPVLKSDGKVFVALISESVHPLVEYFYKTSSCYRLKNSVAWLLWYRENLQIGKAWETSEVGWNRSHQLSAFDHHWRDEMRRTRDP